MSGWTLDKRVPMALIFTIIVQTSGGIWWAAQTTARLDHLEKEVEKTAHVLERLVRIETLMEQMLKKLE